MIKTVLFCPQDLEYSLLQWNCHFKHRETEDQGRGNMLGHSQIRFPYSFQPEHRSRTHGEIKISASCYSSIVLYGEISLTFVFLEGQIIQQNAAAETALWRKCCVTSIVFSLHLLGTWQERTSRRWKDEAGSYFYSNPKYWSAYGCHPQRRKCPPVCESGSPAMEMMVGCRYTAHFLWKGNNCSSTVVPGLVRKAILWDGLPTAVGGLMFANCVLSIHLFTYTSQISKVPITTISYMNMKSFAGIIVPLRGL